MRKFILFTVMLVAYILPSFSQEIDVKVQRKVDSLKRLLHATNGTQKVDILNSIAQGLLWIWESDDRFLYDALKYSDEALQLATKLKYKRGVGYALVNLFYREAHQADTNRVENYKSGSHFQKGITVAKQAIRVGEELHDDLLIGTAYNKLKWLYRWFANIVS